MLEDWEERLLDKTDLSLDEKLVIREKWQGVEVNLGSKPADPKDARKYTTFLSYVLGPLTLVALWANLSYHLPLLPRFCNLLVALVWMLNVGLVSFGALMLGILALHPKIPFYNHAVVAMCATKESGILAGLARLYSILYNVALVVLLALNGYLVTSIAVVLALCAWKTVFYLGKERFKSNIRERLLLRNR
jgi:hypothetical protein